VGLRVRWVCNQDDKGTGDKDDEDGAMAADDDEVPDEEFGTRKVKKVQDPKEPSKEEKLEHEMTHLPYRSWCRHCVRGRGKQMPHREGAQESMMSEVHMDYGFLGKEDEALKTIPIVVAKERTSKMVMAAAVPTKTTGAYISNRVAGFLREVGCMHGDMVMKTDQEPALRTIVEDVGRVKAADGSGRFVVENSPVGASQSNGMVERAIQSVAAQTRVLLSSVEEKWGWRFPSSTPSCATSWSTRPYS
jgi:hypothetical protein